ncbi:mandelate racemase/muconate lactonizing enzyme family protein [Pigmentiphaga litoralis]|uniref:L-alanine-DL-glutamate epimerase-like enolase superfamily enzyme n=1 Tax=Pigmentiphaga litoralis TaxID=516702 RepID=A0A7Y9IRM1_9BURK|nr:mandelate racemase/muconate lactonizing enzyme family protein [Pigmentiphaga litoralis]NYE25323.1 L-alanine-DL-glutamate epimerase-like enolase superfamily enzyme [Pigmentiphaga litoralis]NYE81064.1 L-alanine-DL-glutamate epimerase-like enolase superfamily enzyme [Pigmentiphaga litoralis]
MINADSSLKIARIEGFATSFPVRQGVTLGIGRAVKRDALIVKVTTESGIVGWGESHHGRCPGAIVQLINTTLKQLVLGMDASDVVGVWSRIYQRQLASHGMGTACALAMSGIDQALWDIRGKAVGWPLYKLLGGSRKPLPAYAGGISLGFQPPSELVDEVEALRAQGYRTVKLRFGDTAKRDIERLTAVREACGDDLGIMVDANTGYTLADVRKVMPALDALDVLWLEEPFAPHDYRSYLDASQLGAVPLAAGENHFTRFEFNRLIAEGAVQVLQPDLSKTGGITEALRIAAMASSEKLAIHPHTSASGLNMSASIHFLAAIDNPGYFEADVAKENLFRDALTSRPDLLDENGCVMPGDKPGLGVDVDEDFLRAHPGIEGPAYV